MAIGLVLLEQDADVSLGSATLAGLARLGVTSVALLRDERTIAVVLEGWAFDAAASAEAARAALAGPASPARTLRPLVQMAVSTAPTEGGPS